jgi:hypothetical protein
MWNGVTRLSIICRMDANRDYGDLLKMGVIVPTKVERIAL